MRNVKSITPILMSFSCKKRSNNRSQAKGNKSNKKYVAHQITDNYTKKFKLDSYDFQILLKSLKK